MKELGTVRGPRLDSRAASAGAQPRRPDARLRARGRHRPLLHARDRPRPSAGIGAHEAAVGRVVFSPDSRLAVSTGDDRVAIVWNPATGQPLQRLTGHGGRVLDAAFARDGRTLYTVSLDGTVLQWDLGGGRRFGDTARVGRPVPAGEESPLDPASPTPVLAISPDGRTFAVHAAPSVLALYATSSLRRVGRIAVARGDTVRAAAWSGSRLVLGTDHGAVELWKGRGVPKPVRALHGLESRDHRPVRSLASTDAGRLVAAVDGYHGPRREGGGPTRGRSPRGLARRAARRRQADRPARTRKQRRVLGRLLDARRRHRRRPRARARSVDRPRRAHDPAADRRRHRRLRAGRNTRHRLQRRHRRPLEPDNGKEIGHPTLVAASPVGSIAFDPTGKTFATTGGPSGGARIWVTSTHQQFGADLPGGEGAQSNAAYTPDGPLPARRRRRRNRTPLAGGSGGLGAARLRRRGTQPHPRGMDASGRQPSLHQDVLSSVSTRRMRHRRGRRPAPSGAPGPQPGDRRHGPGPILTLR